MGYIDPQGSIKLVNELRKIKISHDKYSDSDIESCIPKTLEVAFLPSNEVNDLIA